MIGVLLVSQFVTVVLAYACTEYLLLRFDARRRVLIGEGWPLLVLLGSNLGEFHCGMAQRDGFVLASETDAYRYATIICVFAQTVWLTQHLWFYHRDHLRLRYE